jgi:hypothetical protein
MKRPSIVRQTYTTASLVAMIPAAIWAAVAFNSTTMNGTVGAFPFYYLLFCQVLIIPRYAIAAWVTMYFEIHYKKFDLAGGVIGFTTIGVLADIWLTMAFGNAISAPATAHWAGWTVVGAFPVILTLMLAGCIAGGFVAPKIRSLRSRG